ncbi:MAG: hypothetical protein Ct9H300mP22_1050 [Gammaproteobacteria bacterium]|nr:MAG: hypothetical protein Ct9H300mP22_1050 [Gammaproteobacteria bacterium]
MSLPFFFSMNLRPGVYVSLRKDMWKIVEELKAAGVTIIFTTHYIEEAEEIADRVGIINNGN